MSSFLAIFNMLVNLAFWIIIIQAILSWLIAFQVVNMHQPFVRQIWSSLNALTEPLYRPIRRFLPDMGGMDLAPLVVLLGIYSLQIIINNNLAGLAF
ncbi:MAG: YggT family protein [Pseudomonadota bacterium]